MKKLNILIPLDDTSFSRQIIPEIYQLFPPEAASLMLLRVGGRPAGLVAAPPRAVTGAWLEPMYETPNDVVRAHHPIYASQAEASAHAELSESLIPEARALEANGYEVALHVQFGEPAATIIQVAREQDADLVAMATHSRSGISHLLQGSVAEQVLRELTTPVLLLHPTDRASSSNN